MKFCPTCQTRYDEEILRFCIKDGTPLVDENPSFTEMPSESEVDDIDEETVITRNPRKNAPAVQPNFNDDSEFEEDSEPPQRIVISTAEKEPEQESVRAKPLPPPQTQPQKSNTALIVLATMFGTFTILAILGGAWYLLSNRNAANKNVNINTSAPNVNYNVNLNEGYNINTNPNANLNENLNANVNTNLKSPTPAKTPTPTPTATPDANVNSNGNLNLGNTNIMSRPTSSPTPETSATPTTPKMTPTPTASPQNVNVGIMNSRAVSLTKPAYPQTAKQMNASGEVRVQVSVDEGGNVLSARAISGHALLRAAAENAARQSRFNPVKIGDRAVSATGIVVYNFINQ